MRFLIFGDVVGQAGRRAISTVLPQLREEYKPDSVIINIENIAHGRGITPDTTNELPSWGAHAYTTGDHAWDATPGYALLEDRSTSIIRPANYPPGVPGRGYLTYSIGAYTVAVINLQGQVMFKNDPENPFHAIDAILQEQDVKASNITLVDFHAEATSEKRGFGWHVDGRLSAVWGTHTHVPTADAQILPKGTGYISDVGMNGALHSSLGMEIEGPLKMFRTQIKHKFDPATEGPLECNAVLIDIDPKSGKTTAIAHIRKIVNDKK